MERKLWMAVFLLLPLGAVAQPNPAVLGLHQQIVALQLDQALHLTQQQAQALLPILQNARSQVQAAQSQRVASQPALVAALTQAVSDLKAAGGISESTAQAINAARGTPTALRASMHSTWQQARAILTPEQIQALQTTRFGVAALQTNDGSQGPRRSHFARRFQVMHAALSDAFLALVQSRAG